MRTRVARSAPSSGVPAPVHCVLAYAIAVSAPSVCEVWITAGRVLTFRASRDEFRGLHGRHLALGLVLTWVAGVGRHWDDPRATLPQRLGVGSVVYVLVLAAVLWAVLAPLRPEDWSYRRVLTFVTLTAPPALLYAIPVERLFHLDTATRINLWFLGLVALWRVALLVFFLRRSGRMDELAIAVAGLLPIVAIIATLTVLNLQHVVFRIMGGLRDDERSSHDAAYSALFLLTVLSVYAAVPLLIGYIALVVGAFMRRNRDKSDPGSIDGK